MFRLNTRLKSFILFEDINVTTGQKMTVQPLVHSPYLERSGRKGLSFFCLSPFLQQGGPKKSPLNIEARGGGMGVVGEHCAPVHSLLILTIFDLTATHMVVQLI